MKILLFGISNVGKTTIGEALARHLGYKFFDLDEEVKKYYKITLEEFVISGSVHERDKKRGELIKQLMSNSKDFILAVTPIYHSVNFNRFILKEDVLAIELQDSPENIFDRLVFSDENDIAYHDDDYKNLHRGYYISDIKKDVTFYKRSFAKITNKFHMNNDSVEMVVERLVKNYNLA